MLVSLSTPIFLVLFHFSSNPVSPKCWDDTYEPSHLAWLVSSGTTSLACALTCFHETQLRGISPEAETVHTHLTLDI